MVANPRQSQAALLSKKSVAGILSREADGVLASEEKITDLDIKPLKTYLDDKSYGVQALYTATIKEPSGNERQEKIFASAHSSGSKHKDYALGRYMDRWSRENPLPILVVPKVYGYIKSRGLFLRQFIDGSQSKDLLQSKHKLSRSHARLVSEGLRDLHSIRLPSNSKSLDGRSNLEDLKNNLRILRSRSHPEFKQVAKQYQELSRKLEEAEGIESSHRVLCHGDFNPSNIIITEDKKVSLIDFGSASRQHPLWDVAAFCSHLLGMEDLSMSPHQRTKAGKRFLRQYQRHNETIDSDGTELLSIYNDYFDLLATTHKLVWG